MFPYGMFPMLSRLEEEIRSHFSWDPHDVLRIYEAETLSADLDRSTLAPCLCMSKKMSLLEFHGMSSDFSWTF